MNKVERNLSDISSANTFLTFKEQKYGLELVSRIAKEWLEADNRNLSQLRHIQEDRLCKCFQNLSSRELTVLRECFSDMVES